MQRDPLAELAALMTGSGGMNIEALMIVAGIWVLLGIATGMLAHSRGRDGYDWFAYGLLLWPVALVHVFVRAKPVPAEERPPVDHTQRLGEIVAALALIAVLCLPAVFLMQMR